METRYETKIHCDSAQLIHITGLSVPQRKPVCSVYQPDGYLRALSVSP